MERAFTSMIVTGSADFFLFVPFSLLLFGFFQKQASSMHQEGPRGINLPRLELDLQSLNIGFLQHSLPNVQFAA